MTGCYFLEIVFKHLFKELHNSICFELATQSCKSVFVSKCHQVLCSYEIVLVALIYFHLSVSFSRGVVLTLDIFVLKLG